ncbi:NADH-quinone oxidoreductase subunit J [Nakamurella endophytica]|uniref:NADH-quinone oxidoreductase subunit J n=1 Tax=Nakamurella endophytica TaxID=1748367 RepID=UPI001667F831
MLSTVAFWVLAGVAVVFGALVFRVDSMARATYCLAASFVAVAVVLVLFRQDYLGVVTALMMIMEMAIMAVYMVMFMGMNPALMPMSMVHGRRTALGLSVGLFVVLTVGVLLVPWPSRRGTPIADVTRALGESIMGPKMLVMLTVSPVLFATIVAALVLAMPRGRYDRLGDDLRRRPPTDPQRGGVGR